MYMYKIGLSVSGNTLSDELLADLSRAGIGAIEVTTSYEKSDGLEFDRISTLANRYGVELWSFHLPFAPFSHLDISNALLAKQTVEYYAELIKRASDIGIDKFVVHPSGEPIEPDSRLERMKRAKESLADMARIANSYGAVIAVEDLPRTCLGNSSDEIKELLSAHDALRVCFDTNHLLSEDPVDFIHKLGDRIITTHISDYDNINERHWLPGEGCIKWSAVLQAFKDVDYKGVWLYELGFAAPKTIVRERDLTCADFANNAREIFENKKITVLATERLI